MLLFTSIGFFCISGNSDDPSPQFLLLSHARGDLDRLRLAYLPELGPSTETEAGSYKWGAVVDPAALHRALPLLLDAVVPTPFEEVVEGMLGRSRASAIAEISSAWVATGDSPGEPEAEQRPLPWSTAFAAGLRYGAVVVDTHGLLLLRHVPGEFDGYAWTFAKGKPAKGLTARQAARQIVREQFGVEATILTTIDGEHKGSGSVTRYFLMVVDRAKVDLTFKAKATDMLVWATALEARAHIASTTNEAGRLRDYAVLDLVLEMLPASPPLVRPIALRGDWKKHPMAATRSDLDVQGIFSAQEMSRIWRGLIPACMEEKWFAYYEDDVLHLYRSWTGRAFFRIYFQREGSRWSIRRCELTQYPLDNANERIEATQTALFLLRQMFPHIPDELTVDPMVAAFQHAMSPNYLGSPSVVEDLLNQHLALVWQWWAENAETDLASSRNRLARIFAGLDDKYSAIGVWNGSGEMARELVEAFKLEPDEGTSPEIVLRMALTAFERAATSSWDIEKDTEEDPDLVAFCRAVLTGARSALFPGKRISDFSGPG